MFISMYIIVVSQEFELDDAPMTRRHVGGASVETLPAAIHADLAEMTFRLAGKRLISD
jgi:hypothetical protein